MSDLFRYFENNPGRLIHKWLHYFGIYERHFSALRGRPIRLLEYGVFNGGSLQMWKHYFGSQSQIIGVDIDPRCAQLAEPGIDIVIGDQEDPATHARLKQKYGEFDIVIDDGGHRMRQQLVTFQEIYPAIRAGGIYLAEDLHTSYFPEWDGGLRKPGTFIEYAKQLVDQMHACHSRTPDHQPDQVTSTAYGLHFYDSVLVIEKNAVSPPSQAATGVPVFEVGALEYFLLAMSAQHKGQLDVAIGYCRRALAIEPAASDAIALLAKLEAAKSAQMG